MPNGAVWSKVPLFDSLSLSVMIKAATILKYDLSSSGVFYKSFLFLWLYRAPPGLETTVSLVSFLSL